MKFFIIILNNIIFIHTEVEILIKINQATFLKVYSFFIGANLLNMNIIQVNQLQISLLTIHDISA